MIGITTFFNRDERRFKKQLSVYSAVIGVHFFLLGTYPAGASAILNAIRTLITLRTRSLWVMAIFIVLTGGIGLAKFHHPVELLPVIGTIVSTWALFRCKGLTMRCVMWFSLPVFAAEHWIDVRVPEQYQQEHVQGAINIPLKEVKERIATAVPDKYDTVKVYCNAGRQSGQAKEILSEMGYTHVENAGGLKDIAMPKVKG
nr:thiosulfate sulfurtransferase PspE [Escherichia coli]